MVYTQFNQVIKLRVISPLVILSFLISGGLVINDLHHQAIAQIIPDNTLGQESSIINSNNPRINLIEGGAKRGANLFHSFQEFNVSEGQQVYFNNPSGVMRIFSRVTGNNPSNILGKLGVKGQADLFLLNPNGIIFGSYPSLDIAGSFIATTANSVVFGDNTRFSASSRDSLLTVSVPIGLQFGKIIGDIIINPVNSPNEITVSSGKTLILAGGNITLNNVYFSVPQGRVELASIGQDGQVSLNPIEKGWSLGYENIDNFQDIQLTKRSTIFVGLLGGGEVYLQGRNISLLEVSAILGIGANITVNASNNLTIRDNRNVAGFNIYSGIVSTRIHPKQSSNITINTKNLTITNGGAISAQSTFIYFPDNLIIGTGSGGDVIINASEQIEISGRLSNISSGTESFGDGGNITINAKNLTVRNGAIISAESLGKVHIGNIPVRSGKGGTINIVVPGLLELNGGFISSKTYGIGGDAGNININAGKLLIQNQGEILVGSQGFGKAGDLNIQANNLELNNQGKLTAETNLGNGGNISVELDGGGILLMRNHSQISTTAGIESKQGDGGNIFIDAPFIIAVPNENSDITANAFEGRGGKVIISTQGLFGIEPRNELTLLSDITASSAIGLNGIIQINDSEIAPQQQIFQNPSPPELPQILEGCQVERGESASRFVRVGRGGLSSNPIEPLSNLAIWEDIQLPSKKDSENTTTPETIIEAQGWLINEQGKVVLVSNQKALGKCYR